MSTIYVFGDEVPALQTVATDDIVLVLDTSTHLMKRSTVTQVGAIMKTTAWGAAATSTIGFYGVTAVNQGTMTGTAVTALATATISAGNSASTWAWASSTEATNFVTRAQQARTDLNTLLAKIESTGLIAVAGN